MNERRRYIRIPDDSEIVYQIVTYPKQFSFMTRDISLGGARIYTHEFIPKNSLLKLNLKIKKMTFAITILSQVQWIKKDPTGINRYDVGLKFVDAPKDKILYLEEYIRAKARQKL
ncbi:MAG: PilZ domain-containing protein [Candidatus Omnitrophica bacterium]|jgi:c-di-GMP-binding flagellar brake protein YcgR|nr:PilZ domain-containing protein [Candidatus Omnitrophota bacterium]MDD5080958.1 PilZ domain-containing protein [Candidatus Omnitrophota bacterium]MDD5440601.1 PilZ domain-containing protein [Candidatus Omnitrophota bacterium]